MPCERIALRAADRVRLAADLGARLRAGAVGVLPTETVYGLAALPGHATAAPRLRALADRPAPAPLSLHLARRSDLVDLAPPPPRGVERLLERFWPGPVTVVLRGHGGEAIGVRLAAHDFTRDVIAAAGGPIWLCHPAPPGGPAARDPATALAALHGAADFVVDDGPTPLGAPSTVVDATGERMLVLREGILSGDDVLHAAADLVLFVCTGNTCRSPLAEAIAREVAAQRLGIPGPQVLSHGLWFASAGTATLPDMPASDGSLAAAGEQHLDLSAHRSRPLDPALAQRSSRIFCLAQSHRRALLAEVPEVGNRVALLRPDGLDVADPYGGDLRAYRRARDEIRAAVTARVDEVLRARRQAR